MPFFWRFAWAWLALAGRTAIPRLLTRFHDFERREHVPRSSVGIQTYVVLYRRSSFGIPTCVVMSRRTSCVPRNQKSEKDPWAPEKIGQMSEKKCGGGRCGTPRVRSRFASRRNDYITVLLLYHETHRDCSNS